ncbi:MAG: hypothetical protein GY733_03200 [bacterium]|nr:hypothetical protein [bacterium]
MDDPTTLEAMSSDAFRELDFGPWRVVVCSEFATALGGAMKQLGIDRARTLGELEIDWRDGGRAGHAVLSLPGTKTRLHVRPLAHGGALARLTGARFASLERPLAELRVTAELARRGAPIPDAGFVLGRRHGLFWQAAVGSVEIEGCLDGAAFLAGNPDARRLENAARAAGRSVRRFHDLGGRHADLQIENLVLTEERKALRVWLVDLDRARIETALPPRRRIRELMRLHRSLRKRGLQAALATEVQEAFFDAYLDGDAPLRRKMVATLPFERWRNDAHARFHGHA